MHGSAAARQHATEALLRVERGERNALDGLREAICTYRSALEADGTTREDALQRVRELIATPASSEHTWLLPAAREALMDLAMYWCAQQDGDRPDAAVGSA